MFIGRVIGSLEATVKYEGMDGIKLMWVQPVTDSLKDSGEPLVACDSTQSGPGDLVFWVDGREACLAFENTFIPVDATIVGIVDRIGSV